VHRISGAPKAHSEDLNTRMRRYLVSMAVRTACVVLAVVVDGPARWLFVVGAVGLPYVAVVLANAGNGTRRPVPALRPVPVPPRVLPGQGTSDGVRQDTAEDLRRPNG